jgi:hypothetical protein
LEKYGAYIDYTHFLNSQKPKPFENTKGTRKTLACEYAGTAGLKAETIHAIASGIVTSTPALPHLHHQCHESEHCTVYAQDENYPVIIPLISH